VVFGHYDYRFDIPKSEIVAAGRNVIVGIDFPELLKYKVERNAPLPTGEPIDKLAEEEGGEKEEKRDKSSSHPLFSFLLHQLYPTSIFDSC
jgi:hypothetical protein